MDVTGPLPEVVAPRVRPSPHRAGTTPRQWVLVGSLVILTVAAIWVGDGDLALALTPSILTALIGLVWILPLRFTLLAFLAIAWTVEAPGDAFAAGLVETPWKIVGEILWGKLNGVIPFPPLVFSGFDLVALLLAVVVIYRQFHRSDIDRRGGWSDSPRALALFTWLSLAAALGMAAHGLATGGSFRFALWQFIRWLYLPVVYALMRQGLRGVVDAPSVGGVILGVGLFRAGEVIVFRFMFPSIETLPHATTHADSVLFAACVGILGATLLEMPSKRTVRISLLLSPAYIWAMSANNRRLVWAEVAMVAVVFWIMTPWRPLKRAVARAVTMAALPLMLYVPLGWDSSAAIFSPVRKIRSLTDPGANSSTLWRELENYDLVYTYSQAPLAGSGFGHPFIQKIQLPDVTGSYELEPYIPHNSVLGLWAFGGLIGFAALWAVFPVGLFFTARAYRWARSPMERVTALGAAGAQVTFIMQGYGDLGFGAWGPVFTVAAAYALVGKIVVANGGWRTAALPSSLEPVRVPVTA